MQQIPELAVKVKGPGGKMLGLSAKIKIALSV